MLVVATRSTTSAVEDDAKAMYALQRRDGTVSTTALAERLDVTPASVSAMVKKLDRLGLARHEPYHGVVPTAAGRRTALEVLRPLRLLELSLSESLGMSW